MEPSSLENQEKEIIQPTNNKCGEQKGLIGV
jgi:hypothetical protein